jgi:DNA polymerase elongation subunit (family B)
VTVFDGTLGPGLTRADIMGPDAAAQPAAGVLTVALHTFTVMDVYTINGMAVAADSLDDTVLSEPVMAAARAALEAESAARDAAIAGKHRDVEPTLSTVVYVTAHDAVGRKLGFVLPFKPLFYVQVPTGMAPDSFTAFVIPKLAAKIRVPDKSISVSFGQRPRFSGGYEPEADDRPLVRKRYLYARLRFPNRAIMRAAAFALRDGLRGERPMLVSEDNIDLEQVFVDGYRLVPSGWHDVEGAVPAAVRRSLLVDAEYVVPTGGAGFKHRPDLDAAGVPRLLLVSLDIEVTSGTPGRFPRADRDSDAVVCVGAVFAATGGSTPYGVVERRAWVLAPHCTPIPGVHVQLFDAEADLLSAVRNELFVRKRVDVVTGFNILGFDMSYMAARAARWPRSCTFPRFGALIMEHMAKVKEKNLGTATIRYLPGAGFAYVDAMHIARSKPDKLRQYTLHAVAAHYLGAGADKFDMPYDEIPAAIAGPPDAVARLTAYCVQDCVLPMALCGRWSIVADLIAQSRVIIIPMATNVVVGQQQRVRNYLMRVAHSDEFRMVMNGVNEPPKRGPDNKIIKAPRQKAKGGYVMDALGGFYAAAGTFTLDFNSLYPSVQIDNNICWSTVITETDEARLKTWVDHGLIIDTYETPTGTFKFARNVNAPFPRGLRILMAERKRFKAVMATAAKESPAYGNANAAQSATKIVMNSGYGTANAQDGIMPCVAVGTVTCHLGRTVNIAARKFLEAHYGADRVICVYGDTDSIFMQPRDDAPDATLKQRLQHALAMGKDAEKLVNAYLRDTLHMSDVMKTELEKVYLPFLLPGTKKTYAGLKWTPGVSLDDVPDDLSSGGDVDCKGMRAVRRDVPKFCSALSDALFDVLLHHRDEDAFWDIVHTHTEAIVFGELPLDDYTLTQELKHGYETQDIVRPHVAVSYAREWAVRGSGYATGDRVVYVMVEEADEQRVRRPPWLDVKPGTEHVEHASDDDSDDEVKLPALPPTAGMYARSPDEIVADPDHNHLDIMYYVERGVCSLLKQMMPTQKHAQEALIAYATAAQLAYRDNRARRTPESFAAMFSGGEMPPVLTRATLEPRLPKLAHKCVEAPVTVMTIRSVFGEVVTVPLKAQRRIAPPPPPTSTPAPPTTMTIRNVFGKVVTVPLKKPSQPPAKRRK